MEEDEPYVLPDPIFTFQEASEIFKKTFPMIHFSKKYIPNDFRPEERVCVIVMNGKTDQLKLNPRNRHFSDLSEELDFNQTTAA